MIFQWSNEKTPGCLGYIGGYTTQLCEDVTYYIYSINHYKDPGSPLNNQYNGKYGRVFVVAQLWLSA